MNPKLLIAVLPLSLGLMAAVSPPDGKSIVNQGSASGAPPCVACHGSGLEGNAAMKAPALSGLPEAKIRERLAHYAGPEGHNAAMKAVATALSPEEKAAVALYISHLSAGKTGASK